MTGKLKLFSIIQTGIVLFIAVFGLLGYLPGPGVLGSIKEHYIPMIVQNQSLLTA